MTIPKGQSCPWVKRIYTSGSKLTTCDADMHLFQTPGANHGQPWFPLILVLYVRHNYLYYTNSTTMVSLEKPTHELQTSSDAVLNRWALRVVYQEQYQQDLESPRDLCWGWGSSWWLGYINDIADETYSAVSKWQMEFHPSKCKTLTHHKAT